MPIQFLSGNTYDAYSGTVPDQIIVDPLATVHTTAGSTPAMTLASGPWPVTVNGKVVADDGHGINLKDAGPFSSNSDVIVGPDAEVVGGGPSSIGINAAHPTNVVNGGLILGGTTGIAESGDGGFVITNNEEGVIEGGRYGIHASFSGAHLILNDGTVSGGEYAILGESGEELVQNTGTLEGNVHLGDGNDVFHNFYKDQDLQYDGTVTGTIDLGKGDDMFKGGNNREVLRDGDGKDGITLGGGDDTWFGFLAGGDDGADTVSGGAGIDTYDARQSGVKGVKVNLDAVAHAGLGALSADDSNALTAADSVRGLENAYGTDFADIVFGANGANKLVGRQGDDKLYGLDGNDVLLGDAGLDLLRGGLGKDSLFGGDDRDIFDFNSIKESRIGANRDTIQDFKHGNSVTGDDIDLVGIDAKSGVSGNQTFKFIGKQDFHGVKGELHYKDLGDRSLVQGDVNGDAKADFEIMVKAGALSSGDFLL